MKKIFIVLCIGILTLAIVSCNLNSKGFEIYEESEIQLVRSQKKDSLKNQSKQMTVDGRTVIAKYEETESSPYYTNGEVEYYRYSDSNSFYFWGIDPSTDRIVSYSWGSREDARTEYEVKKSLEDCQVAAETFLKQYVNDFSSYSLEKSRSSDSSYSFTFSKIIDDMLTCDHAIVNVKFDGSIRSYHLQSFGSIDFDQLPDCYTQRKAEVDQALSLKLDKIYSKEKNRGTVSCSLDEVRCMKYNGNQFAIAYQYDVKINNEKNNYSELTTLIVVFD